MRVTYLEPDTITYTQSVGFAYVELAFTNYPFDWDGFYIELLDTDSQFALFKQENYKRFRPINSVPYDDDDDPILLDTDGDPLYGGTSESPTEPDKEVSIKTQLETKKIDTETGSTGNKIIYFAPFRLIGNNKIIGRGKKYTVSPGVNYININQNVFYTQTTEPTVKRNGDFWKDTTLDELKIYSNGTWILFPDAEEIVLDTISSITGDSSVALTIRLSSITQITGDSAVSI